MIPVGILTAAATSSFSFLLDLYPGASAAYSLRKLKSAYTGSCIRVRRSSDNAETDIGFVANVLDTSTLLTFCGGVNGFITKWYDQSGNANDLYQTNTTIQPSIVTSGALTLINGKPYFVISNPTLIFTTNLVTLANSNHSLFCVHKQSVTNDFMQCLLQGGSNYHWLNYGLSQYVSSSSFITISSSYISNVLYLTSHTCNATVSSQIHRNNILIGSTGVINSTAQSNTYMGGKSSVVTNSEFIFYPSNQAANRAAIDANINSFYTIF